MLAYPLSILGLLLSVGLLVQVAPGTTGNLNMWGLRLAFTVATWIVTLPSVLILADRGSFAFAGESKLGVVALHVFWGVACLLTGLEIAPTALALRIAIGLVPLLINLALLLPSVPAHAVVVGAMACQLIGTGGFFIYASVASTMTDIAEDTARAERHSAEAKEYSEALQKELDKLNAESPLEEFFQHTRNAKAASRDQVVAAAIAKKPNLEAELIASLHSYDQARWGARTFVASPLIPRTAALVAAVSDSILLEANDIVEASSVDRKEGAAYGAVEVAESMPEHKAALRPAMLKLREVTGPPVKKPGYVTGREELARCLR